MATQHCGGAPTVCLGLPPASCTAFGESYQPVIGDTRACVECKEARWLFAVLLVGLGFVIIGLVAAAVAVLHYQPRGIRQWMSTCSILLSHVQGLAIIASLRLEWPRIVLNFLGA
eukprot:603351-Prymnesium_polylepis.1